MFGRSNTFDRALDKATSQLLLDPDWDNTLQICDCIRQLDVQPKYAVNAIKRKIAADNNHITLFSLGVLEAIMKNCGTMIHTEIATKDFMEFFKDQINRRPDMVKQKMLDMIQGWAYAFKDESKYRMIGDTCDLLKHEGHTFPPLIISDAMFTSEAAPAWKDGNNCIKCKVSFGTFNRKHHCRSCGDIFCHKCSPRQAIIPKFGIEKEVRVCEQCYEKLNNKLRSKRLKSKNLHPSHVNEDDDSKLPEEYLNSPLAKQSQVPNKKSEQELQEEEELQLALALSKSEEEEKSKQRALTKASLGLASHKAEEAKQVDVNTEIAPPTKKLKSEHAIDTSDMDPELARYLNRNYWEEKQAAAAAAKLRPSPSISPQPSAPAYRSVERLYEQPLLCEQDPAEQEFLTAMGGSIQIFVNRMRSDSERGRSISIDTSVQTLFNTISAMHPRLIASIGKCEEKRAKFEMLQDKISQLMDAREALNMLRQQHAERRAVQEAAEERRRQQEMATTLGNLRHKKQEYLQYQHQIAVEKMHAQEAEMAKRLEHQKHQQRIRALQYTSGALSTRSTPYGNSNTSPYASNTSPYASNSTGYNQSNYMGGTGFNSQIDQYGASSQYPTFSSAPQPSPNQQYAPPTQYNQAPHIQNNQAPQHNPAPQHNQAPPASSLQNQFAPPQNSSIPNQHRMSAPQDLPLNLQNSQNLPSHPQQFVPQQQQTQPPKHYQPQAQHNQTPPTQNQGLSTQQHYINHQYQQQQFAGSLQHNQAPPPQFNQAPPSQHNQAPPPQFNQAPPSQHNQAATPQFNQAPPSQHNQAPLSQHNQAQPPQNNQTPSPQHSQALPPQQQYVPSNQAPPPQQQYTPSHQPNQAPPPQQQYAPSQVQAPPQQQQYAPTPQQQYSQPSQQQYAQTQANQTPQQQYAPQNQQQYSNPTQQAEFVDSSIRATIEQGMVNEAVSNNESGIIQQRAADQQTASTEPAKDDITTTMLISFD